MIVNTEMIKENHLDMPESLKDLTKPEYKDLISVTDVKSSSTAWLLIQALVDAYGEDGAKETLTGIYENAGPHIETSGSAPLKKVRAGEVAVGFGLRQQAVADKAKGLPIDFVDPTEGNFSRQSSVGSLWIREKRPILWPRKWRSALSQRDVRSFRAIIQTPSMPGRRPIRRTAPLTRRPSRSR